MTSKLHLLRERIYAVQFPLENGWFGLVWLVFGEKRDLTYLYMKVLGMGYVANYNKTMNEITLGDDN